MHTKSKSAPKFYIDTLPVIDTINIKERLRFVKINSTPSTIFIWISQLRIAPYSYDFLDNRGRKSPKYIIKNLPPLKSNHHFLLAFNIDAFEQNSFIVGKFCEPIIAPVNLFIKGLFIEYRLIEKDDFTELWCKIKGFVRKDIFSNVFFIMFLIINRFMMNKQLKIIKNLSEKLTIGEVKHKKCNYNKYYVSLRLSTS